MAAGVRLVAGLGFAALIVAGCAANGQPVGSVTAATARPAMTVSPAVNQTRAELVRVLSAANLVLADTQVPVRPAESVLLAAAPRAVFQVTLPADPTRGFIVVYEFRDASRASEAAAEEQLYLASGPGRVQTPEGTVHVLRQVGPTVVLYDWLPGAAKDPSAPEVQRALETLGVGYPIAR
ncbi:MAG: hypothetical protein WEE50_12235 [Chloroflexota bacterium]